MKDEEFDELNARLRALAASTARAEAPPRVEAALRAAFRGRRAARARWRWGLAAAAALAAIAGAAMWAWRPRPLQPVRAPIVAPAAPPVHLARAPAPQPKPARRIRRRPPPRREIVTEFIPLVNDAGWTPAEPAQIVRVRMPRSALLPLGLPLNEDRALEPIQADVIVGYDGVARAIRFVR